MRTLLVVGGTGVLGARIVRLAREQSIAEQVLVGSRSGPGVRIDVRDRASIERALDGVDVVIDAVGPFEYDPRPLVGACAARGSHYVDIAETESFLAAVREAAARCDRSAAVTGASTVPGMVEVLAQALAPSSVERVRAYLSVGTANEASATLVASMLAPIGTRLADGSRAFDELVRVEHRGIGTRVYGRYPSGADASGIVLRTPDSAVHVPHSGPPRLGEGGLATADEELASTHPRSTESRTVPLELFFGCDRALYTRALGAASSVLGRSRRLASIAARAAMPMVPLVRAVGTDVGILRVEALDRSGRALASIEVRAREHGLDVPALPAVWAAGALRSEVGALRLADLIDARDAMMRLEAAGFEVIEANVDEPAARERTRESWKER